MNTQTNLHNFAHQARFRMEENDKTALITATIMSL